MQGLNQSDMSFLLSEQRKRELYESTILNMDRSVNEYMEKKLSLHRQQLENEFIASLKNKPFEPDQEVIERTNQLQIWIDELKQLKQTMMMNWSQLQGGSQNLQM